MDVTRDAEEILCAITFDPIPLDRLITVQESEHTYHFDILSLYRDYIRRHTLLNPFTLQPLPPEINRKVRIFGETQKCIVIVNDVRNGLDDQRILHVDSFITIGELLIEILRELKDISSFTSFCLDIIDFYSQLETPIESISGTENTLKCALKPINISPDQLYLLYDFIMKRQTEPYAIHLYDLIINHLKIFEREQRRLDRREKFISVWASMLVLTESFAGSLVVPIDAKCPIDDYILLVQVMTYDDLHNFEILVNNHRCITSMSLGPILELLSSLNYPHTNKYLDAIFNVYPVSGDESISASCFRMLIGYIPNKPRFEKSAMKLIKILLRDRSKLELIRLGDIKNERIRKLVRPR